jgi:outer membrane biosynthesis protein TonB
MSRIGVALQLKPVKTSWLSNAGAAASVLGHLAVIAVVLLFTGVEPFEPDSAKAITVDLVTPDEIKPPEDKKPPPDQKGATPQALPAPIAKAATEAQAAEPPKAQAAPAPKDQPDTSQPPAREHAAASDQKPPQQQIAALPATPQAATAPEPSQPAAPAYKPPEPDLSVKYGVMFGLPNADGNSDFDSAAVEKAEVSKVDIAAFRRHLKSCSTLPSSVAPSDDVSVKLRVALTPDGRLAQEPILIAGTASAKGPALMKAAAAALEACAPYTMLPSDSYAQWKVLDLTFSPRDFNNG